MNVTGKIVEILEVQQVSATFKKREFVIEYAENPQYPEFVKFETIQDKCAMLDNLSNGDEVSVEFNLKGRKWTDPQGATKYFNSLQAWKISQVSSGVNANAGDTQQPIGEEPDWMSTNKEEEGDLPF